MDFFLLRRSALLGTQKRSSQKSSWLMWFFLCIELDFWSLFQRSYVGPEPAWGVLKIKMIWLFLRWDGSTTLFKVSLSFLNASSSTAPQESFTRAIFSNTRFRRLPHIEYVFSSKSMGGWDLWWVSGMQFAIHLQHWTDWHNLSVVDGKSIFSLLSMFLG